MAEHRKLTDEELAAACKSGELPRGVSVSDLAHETLRGRTALREDSRRGDQFRRLRLRVEEFRTDFVDRVLQVIGAEEAQTVEKIAAWVEREGGMPQDATLARFIREGRWR